MKARAFWPLLLLACLLTATTVAGIKLWPRIAPPSEVSDLYLHYESNPHLNVAFINDFQVNDSISVDVTTLQALDSSGWETLKKDFHAFSPSEIVQQKIDNGIDVISMHLAPKTNPTLPMDTSDLLNNNVIAISRLHKTISIFNITSEAEKNAVQINQFEISIP